jgi:hypothetical protein
MTTTWHLFFLQFLNPNLHWYDHICVLFCSKFHKKVGIYVIWEKPILIYVYIFILSYSIFYILCTIFITSGIFWSTNVCVLIQVKCIFFKVRGDPVSVWVTEDCEESISDIKSSFLLFLLTLWAYVSNHTTPPPPEVAVYCNHTVNNITCGRIGNKSQGTAGHGDSEYVIKYFTLCMWTKCEVKHLVDSLKVCVMKYMFSWRPCF